MSISHVQYIDESHDALPSTNNPSTLFIILVTPPYVHLMWKIAPGSCILSEVAKQNLVAGV